MFSATSGRSCFSLTMSVAPLASFVLVHFGTRSVGAFPGVGALVRLMACASADAVATLSARLAKSRSFAALRMTRFILLASHDVVATVWCDRHFHALVCHGRLIRLTEWNDAQHGTPTCKVL